MHATNIPSILFLCRSFAVCASQQKMPHKRNNDDKQHKKRDPRDSPRALIFFCSAQQKIESLPKGDFNAYNNSSGSRLLA